MSKVIINDMTLRDGMHPQRHQTTVLLQLQMKNTYLQLCHA